jgi:hypothetical protein
MLKKKIWGSILLAVDEQKLCHLVTKDPKLWKLENMNPISTHD